MNAAADSRPQVVLVAGTRPEVIKLAPLHRELSRSTVLRSVFVSTGQHRQMLDQAFAAFGLTPDEDLELMQPGQDLTGLTARVVESMGRLLARRKPAAVVVQGDTTTVLGTALAAFYARVPIGHVEAGLRTYTMSEPWPEEMNRRLVAPISRWCFAPTNWSKSNLLSERIPEDRIFVTGNTVVDALHWIRSRTSEGTNVDALCRKCAIPDDFRARHLVPGGYPWILVTGHRRESFGEGIQNICDALVEICNRHPDVGVLYPVHLNPQVQKPVTSRLGGHSRIALIPPVGYEELIWLMGRCRFVISDSGGIQEEAPSLGKPVLVTRATTERPEGVTAGTCRLVGTNPTEVIRESTLLINDAEEYVRRSAISNPYGDGKASARIRAVLEKEL